MPDRTSETTQVRYDSRLRTEVLRVLQREEFDEPKENRVFFRVIAQEFVEDRYGYSPISEPQIVDEGYLPMRKPQSQSSRRSSSRNKRKRGRSNKRQPLSITSHRLEKYEFMTPNTIHLVAKNGQVEGFIDFLYDGDTDDIDILQKLNRCIDEAIRRGSIFLGRFSRRFVERAIDVWYELRYRYSKWEKIIRYESADIMYHLRYRAKKFQKILKIKFEQMMNDWEM